MIKRNPPNPIKKKRGSKMGKREDGPLVKKMAIPGMDKFKDIIQGNTPTAEGIYLVFYEYVPPQAWSKTKEVAGMDIANYSSGQWGLNHKVYAYMGPLPCLALPPLKDCIPPYLTAQTFFTGTLEQAAKGKYTKGPFPQYMLAFLTPGKIGDFIFCMDSENINAYPIAKFMERKDGHLIFKKLSEKAKKKYNRMMGHLRKKND